MEDTEIIVQTKEDQQVSFKKTHELNKLLKDFKNASADALKVLQAGLNSKDEKIRTACADKIIAFYVSIAKEVNTDQLNRLILEVKSGGAGGKSVKIKDGGGKETPRIDFDTIRQVGD